ncbi:MAG: tetratricopeptide repeat protein [Deltaproteobacteria bacterium]|nr:tetratricopeptide repeat protein [Deltaproteobacteria bacterium]
MGWVHSCQQGGGFRAEGAPLYPRARWCQRVLLALGLVLAAGCSGNQEAVRRDAQTAFKLGVAYLAEGRPSPALQELTRADALSPKDPETLNALGLAYWQRREFELAIRHFQKATEAKPDFSEAWNNLGALYIDQGRYDLAIPPLEKALANVFYGTQERALANLGWALLRVGRSQEAEQKLRQAVEVSPSFPLPHKFLGIALQERGIHQEAVAQLDEAIRLYPDDADTYLRRGLSQFKLGEKDAARASFEKAWHLAPGGEPGKSAKTYLDMLQ